MSVPTVADVAPYLTREMSFKLDGAEFHCHVRSVQLTTDTPIESWQTACPDGSGQAAGKTTYGLEIEYYQSWADDTLASYLVENAGEQATFAFSPNGSTPGPDNPTWSGDCILIPGQIGGAVGEFATSTVTLPVLAKPTFTRPA